MRSNSLAGTSPRNTSDSVPRLTALCSVRTSTSPAPGAALGAIRIAARPGASNQQARGAAAGSGVGWHSAFHLKAMPVH